MAVATLTMKGVLQLGSAPINSVTVPATASLKPHVVTVDAIIRSRQVFLMVEKDIALCALHLDDYRAIYCEGCCYPEKHTRQQHDVDMYFNHPTLLCI